MMVHEMKTTKKKRLPESMPLRPLLIPNAASASEKTRELAMMNITIVILEEVKSLRQKISDLEDGLQRSDARNRKQGKTTKRRRRSPLHISRQRSFCTPPPTARHRYKNKTKKHISIRIIPPRHSNHHHHETDFLPIRKRKINVFFSATTTDV